MHYLYVALGGAIGSVLRYASSNLIGHYAGNTFPFATLFINIAGSCIMGLLIGWLGRSLPANAAELRLFIAVGILGGYTTFSAFSLDTIVLLENNKFLYAFMYVTTSILFSFAALFAGLSIMRHYL